MIVYVCRDNKLRDSICDDTDCRVDMMHFLFRFGFIVTIINMFKKFFDSFKFFGILVHIVYQTVTYHRLPSLHRLQFLQSFYMMTTTESFRENVLNI